MTFKEIKEFLWESFEKDEAARKAQDPIAAISFKAGFKGALKCLETLDESCQVVTLKSWNEIEVH